MTDLNRAYEVAKNRAKKVSPQYIYEDQNGVVVTSFKPKDGTYLEVTNESNRSESNV